MYRHKQTKKTTVPTDSTQNDTFQRVADTVNPLEKPQPRNGNFITDTGRLTNHQKLCHELIDLSTSNIICICTALAKKVLHLLSHDQIDLHKPHSAAVKILSELDRQIRLGHESENSRTGSLLTSFQEEARLALLDRLGEEYPPLKESLHREFLKVQENFQDVDARTQAFQYLSLDQGFHLALRKPIQTMVEKYDSPLGYRLNYFELIQDSNQQNQLRALIQTNLTPLTKDLLHFDYDTIYQRKQSDLDRVLSDFAKESILAPIISEAPPRAWEI